MMARHAEQYRVWEKRVARAESSGLSAAAFCRQLGLSVALFYQWRRRLRPRAAAAAQAAAQGFVPLRFAGPTPPADCGVTVVLGPVRLVLAPGFDVGELLRVVRALADTPC